MIRITRNKRKIAPLTGGEANTISNVGVGGVSVVDTPSKVGVDLKVKSINAGPDGGVAVVDDVTNDEIDLTMDILSLAVDLLPASDGSDQMPYMDIADGNKVKRAPMSVIVSKGGAILKPSGTLKGDLLVVLAPDVFVRLPVGADGQILTADSAQAAGVKWTDRRFSFGVDVPSPTLNSYQIILHQPTGVPITVRRVWGITDTATSTADIKIVKRTEPNRYNSAGETEVITTALTINTSGAEDTTIDNPSVAEKEILLAKFTAIGATAPANATIIVEYTAH